MRTISNAFQYENQIPLRNSPICSSSPLQATGLQLFPPRNFVEGRCTMNVEPCLHSLSKRFSTASRCKIRADVIAAGTSSFCFLYPHPGTNSSKSTEQATAALGFDVQSTNHLVIRRNWICLLMQTLSRNAERQNLCFSTSLGKF